MAINDTNQLNSLGAISTTIDITCGKIAILENGIAVIQVQINYDLQKQDIVEINQVLARQAPQPVLVLALHSNGVNLSFEAQRQAARYNTAKAVALVHPTSVSKAIAELLFHVISLFNKELLIKSFPTPEDAMAWLLTQK